MKKRIKTKKKYKRKYKSKRYKKKKYKSKKYKNIKNQKGGSGIALGVGALLAGSAYLGRDGPQKCIFSGCESHYYHFPGNRGWWSNNTRNSLKKLGISTGEEAEYLGSETKYDNIACPNHVDDLDKPNLLLKDGLKTFKTVKHCDIKGCNNKSGGYNWWKEVNGDPYEDDYAKYYVKFPSTKNSGIEWMHPTKKDEFLNYCPTCTEINFCLDTPTCNSTRRCDNCGKPLSKRNLSDLNYCSDCKKDYLVDTKNFTANGVEYKLGNILTYSNEGVEYEAIIEGLYKNKDGNTLLGLKLNKWNDLITEMSEPHYGRFTDETTIILENNESKLYPWVSIRDGSRKEYKEKLIQGWKGKIEEVSEGQMEDQAEWYGERAWA